MMCCLLTQIPVSIMVANNQVYRFFRFKNPILKSFNFKSTLPTPLKLLKTNSSTLKSQKKKVQKTQNKTELDLSSLTLIYCFRLH